MGLEEYVDLDLEEFQRRTNDRLLALIEKARPALVREFGSNYTVEESLSGRVRILVGQTPVYIATTVASGRLLLTDVSGRFEGRL